MSSRRPLVLLHGFGCSPAVWTDVLPLLEGDVVVSTYDGHRGGRSPADPKQITVADLVDGVARDLDDAGITHAHLVGNSLGGWIALQLATRGYAASVTCLAPAGGWRPGSAFEASLLTKFVVAHWVCQRHTKNPASGTVAGRLLLRSMVHRPDRVRAPSLDRLLGDIGECEVIGSQLLRQRGRNFTEPVRVRVPVTIAWPEHDHVLGRPKARARFRQLVPDAEIVTLPDAGHLPMLDRPSEVAALINGCVRDYDGTSQPNAKGAR